MLILSKLYYGGKERLGEELNADDYMYLVKIGLIRVREPTFVDELKLGDYMESDVREFVFQHLQEHGEKMCDCSRKRQSTAI